jgi:hypothetical protein
MWHLMLLNSLFYPVLSEHLPLIVLITQAPELLMSNLVAQVLLCEVATPPSTRANGRGARDGDAHAHAIHPHPHLPTLVAGHKLEVLLATLKDVALLLQDPSGAVAKLLSEGRHL